MSVVENAPPPRRGRWIPEIEAIKGLAIVGVLFAHLSFVSRFDAPTLSMIGGFQRFFGWCVIAFFFTAGLTTARVRSLAEAWAFSQGKFRRLLVPCFVFSVSYKALFQVLYLLHIGTAEPPFPTFSVARLGAFLFESVPPQFYFLEYLFFVSVAVALARVLLDDRALVAVAGAAFLAYGVLADIPRAGYGSDFSLIPVYAYAYIAGCALSPRGKPRGPLDWALALAPPALGLAVNGNPTMLYLAAPLLLYPALGRLGWLCRAVNATRLGHYSSGAYVWHDPILLPVMSILWARAIHGPWVVLPTIVCTLALCYALHEATHRLGWLRWWRF